MLASLYVNGRSVSFLSFRTVLSQEKPSNPLTTVVAGANGLMKLVSSAEKSNTSGQAPKKPV